MPDLTRDEALARASTVAVTRMEVDLDLTRGEQQFGSFTVIRFDAEPGSETFAEIRPETLHRATLNGRRLPRAAYEDGRLTLRKLREHNVLEVYSTMRYRHDGQGLHRATDPADGEDYVYGHLFLDAAPTVFACFDQPDLKAPYVVTVTAPDDWRVIANGAGERGPDGRWVFRETRPLATYFTTVCAGPYVSVEDEHDGIPLGVHARASLAEQLEEQGPQILEITRQSFDYLHGLFGIRYPFDKYDQVFVPEFNAGAMENPGCVTFRDSEIHRGVATRDQLEGRSNTVAHELAHMWFGNLVTMRWWDDLWLNESFAEYMSHRTLADATEFSDAWVGFCPVRKAWGYAADRAPSTHPVAGSPAPDGASALANFDGISYAKGASALRQLIAHIGDDAFVSGVRAYLEDYSYGNGELADFIAAMEGSSGQDLQDWSSAWLETASLDALTLDREAGVLRKAAPAAYSVNRPHTLDVAGFGPDGEVFREQVSLDGDEIPLSALGEHPDVDVIAVNAGDLTWAAVVPDERTVAALPERLGAIPDAMARAVLWVSLQEGVARAEVDPRQLLRVIEAAWPQETTEMTMARVADYAVGVVVPRLLRDDERADALALLDRAGDRALREGSSEGAQVIGARLVARTSADEGLLTAWAAGEHVPEMLEGDSDFRWLAIQTLAQRGCVSAEDIAAFESEDQTLSGHLKALAARASLPDGDAKEWAWEQLTRNRDLSNYERNAIGAAFWTGGRDLLRPYVRRFHEELPAMREFVGEDALGRLARLAYPVTAVEPETLAVAREALERDDLPAGVRRGFVDGEDLVREALDSLSRYGTPEDGAEEETGGEEAVEH
ncbi:aminopeptidase N [Actinomycetota bacterium]